MVANRSDWAGRLDEVDYLEDMKPVVAQLTQMRDRAGELDKALRALSEAKAVVWESPCEETVAKLKEAAAKTMAIVNDLKALCSHKGTFRANVIRLEKVVSAELNQVGFIRNYSMICDFLGRTMSEVAAMSTDDLQAALAAMAAKSRRPGAPGDGALAEAAAGG